MLRGDPKSPVLFSPATFGRSPRLVFLRNLRKDMFEPDPDHEASWSLTAAWAFEAVQKVLSTLTATSGNLIYRRFSKLYVVEMAFRPTFWTASAAGGSPRRPLSVPPYRHKDGGQARSAGKSTVEEQQAGGLSC